MSLMFLLVFFKTW